MHPIPPSLPRTALVTGGAVRLGEAQVLALAGAGFAVAIHCNRSRDAADALAHRVTQAGGTAAVVQADLADEAAVAARVGGTVHGARVVLPWHERDPAAQAGRLLEMLG